jgi:hypothetical protein
MRAGLRAQVDRSAKAVWMLPQRDSWLNWEAVGSFRWTSPPHIDTARSRHVHRRNINSQLTFVWIATFSLVTYPSRIDRYRSEIRQTMQRLIARILFLTALLGTFVPVALAIGAPAPHACCLRKSRNDAGKTQFQAIAPPGNCCPPRTPKLWATPVSFGSLQCMHFVVAPPPEPLAERPVPAPVSSKSVRGPPTYSIA